MARKPRVPHAIRERAREAARATGPMFRADLECQNCGAKLEATYTVPRERFRCPQCGRNAAIRCGDDEPYPPPPEPLGM